MLRPLKRVEDFFSSKDPAAVALGRKGGKAQAEEPTAKQRKEIAKKAAKTRWDE